MFTLSQLYWLRYNVCPPPAQTETPESMTMGRDQQAIEPDPPSTLHIVPLAFNLLCLLVLHLHSQGSQVHLVLANAINLFLRVKVLERKSRFTTWLLPWSVLQLRAMWMSMICAPTGGHAEVHGLCCHQGPWWCLWSILLPEAMCKSMIHAATDYKEQGSFFCSDSNDYRFMGEIERYRRLLWQPPPSPKSNDLNRKPLKRTL